MSSMDKVAKELYSAITKKDERTPKPYDTEATVVREEGDTIWVKIPGGIDETPVRKTINAKPGDNVQVRVADGRAWVMGNSTNPPTDDSTANYAVDLSTNVQKDVVVLNTVVAENIEATNARFGNVEADTAKIHDLTADQLTATVGYIEDLTADHITADDISADHATIGSLDTNYAHISNGVIDNAKIGHADVNGLNANYAQINAANITDLSAQNAWVNKIMVQTGLLAHEGTVFTLDAIQVNAANITAGTIDVNRLIVTVDGEKYLVEIDPTTHQPSYEKLDGGIVEPRTITADKIVAHDITVQEITTENLVGTNGWINLNQGKFFYGDGANFASATNAISWNGSKLQIKADEFLLSTGQTIQDSIESVENWFYSVPPTTSNPPASSWTTTNLKEQHLRDIYFDTTSGKSYRWAKEGTTYKWVEIEDVELAALAKDLHDNYPPRSEFTVAPDQIQSTVSAAQTAATNAANSATDTKLQSYYTKTQTDSAITQKAGEISLSVAQTEIGKIEVGGRNLVRRTDYSVYGDSSYGKRGGSTVTFSDDRVTVGFASEVYLYPYSKQILKNYFIPQGTEIICSVYVYEQTIADGNHRIYVSPINSSGNVSWVNIKTVPVSFTGLLTWSFTTNLDTYGFVVDFDARNSTSGQMTLGRIKAEKGNKATDWTPAPEDVEDYTDTQVSAAKAEIKVTTDGISTEVSKVSSVKYYDAYGDGWTLNNIKTWSTEGYSGTWTLNTSNENIRIGDTIYLRAKDTTRNCYVYIKLTVTAKSGTTGITATSHGYEDILPVETIKSTINQSSDSVKIKANHIEIDGTATFNAIKSSADAAYDAKGAAQTAVDGIEVGGRNLLTRPGDSSYTYTANGLTFTYDSDTGYFTVTGTNTKTDAAWGVNVLSGRNTTRDFYVKAGEQYQFSTEGNLPAAMYLQINGHNTRNREYALFNVFGNGSNNSKTITVPDNHDNSSALYPYFVGVIATTGAVNCKFRVKLEKGNKTTDWSPAPEDVDAEIANALSAANDAQSTANGANAEEQRIYYRTDSAGSLAKPTAWITYNSYVYNDGRSVGNSGWSRVVTPIANSTSPAKKYLYLYSAIQRKTVDGTITCSDVLLDGTTTVIDGGNIVTGTVAANQIAANSIGAKHLTISDNTNLVTANEMYESSLPSNLDVSWLPAISGGYLVKKSATQSYLMVTHYTSNNFKQNDELYYEFYGKAAVAGTVSLYVWGYTGTPPTHTYLCSDNLNINLTTSEAQYSGTLKLTSANWNNATQYIIGFNDGRSTKSQIYIRKLIIRRKNGGELIVDGSITSDHISANKISASKIKVDEINIGAAQITSGTIATARIPNLSADKITSGTINIGRIPDDALNSKIDVGGTNLLKEIGAIIYPTSYNFARIPLTEKLVAGQTYTFQVWGVSFSNTPNTNNTLSVYWGGGNLNLGTISSFSNGYGYVTFTPTAADVAHAAASHYYFNLYNTIPSSSKTARGITITHWKLEKGNKPTAWTPSPTDKEGKENILRGTDKMLNGNGYYDTGTFRASGGTISHGDFTNGSILSGATGYAIVTNSGSSAANVGLAQDRIPAKYATSGVPYTLSCWVKGNSTAVGTTVYIQPLWKSSTQTMEPQSTPSAYRVALDTQWQYVSLTGTLTGAQVTDYISGGYVYAVSMPVGGELHVAGLKLEQSTGASAWSCGTEARADTYVTDIDENGIYISPASQSPTSSAAGNSVKINASGTYVYKSNYLKAKYEDTITLYGGSNASGANPKTEVSSTEVAMYGADGNKRVSVSSGTGVVLGLSNKGHVTITDAAVSLYDTNNKERTQVNTSGLLVKNAAGNTKASIYDTITLYAGAGTYPLAQISGSAIKMAQSANNYINVNSSGLQIYQNNSNVANFGASTIELGKNSNTSIIKFCNGLGTIQKTQKRWDEETPYQDFLTLQSASVSLETPSTASYYGTIAVYSGTASNQGGVIDITANGQDDEYARLYVGAYYNDNSDANEAIISMDADWIELERGSIYHLSYNLPGKHSQTANAIWHKNDAGSYKLCQPSSSSRRYKEDIKPVENDRLDPHRLYDIPVMQFKFKEGYFEQDDPYEQDRKDVIGFIAEDVYEHYPQAAIMIDEEVENWDERYIIPPMLKLIQEQNDRITELERRLS